MNGSLLCLAGAAVVVLMGVLVMARKGNAPVGPMRGRPDGNDVGLVMVALLSQGALAALAYSPCASAMPIVGLAILGNAVVLILSTRRRGDPAQRDASGGPPP